MGWEVSSGGRRVLDQTLVLKMLSAIVVEDVVLACVGESERSLSC
jgi:hypothetical protein